MKTLFSCTLTVIFLFLLAYLLSDVNEFHLGPSTVDYNNLNLLLLYNFHILCAFFFAFMGPFQFALSFYNKWPPLYRIGAFIYLTIGYATIITGTILTWNMQFLPRTRGLSFGVIAFNYVDGAMLLIPSTIALFFLIRHSLFRYKIWAIRAYIPVIGFMLLRLITGVLSIEFSVGDSRVVGDWLGTIIALMVVEWIFIANIYKRRFGSLED